MTYAGLAKPKASAVYVYLIESDEHVKVGLSADPNGRLAALSTASPIPLNLAHTWRCQSLSEARQLEARIHGVLAWARANGEWFSVSVGFARGVGDALLEDAPARAAEISQLAEWIRDANGIAATLDDPEEADLWDGVARGYYRRARTLGVEPTGWESLFV